MAELMTSQPLCLGRNRLTKSKMTRFQTEPCVENPVPLPRWQRLDRSPQSKVQPARAIASSWDFKREEKSAGPKIVGRAAVATKFSTPLAIESVAHEQKRGHDRLLFKGWTCKVDWGPGAKNVWGRSIPKILHLMNGRSVCVDGVSPAEIMWKVTHGEAQEVKDMEERSKRLSIKKMIDEKGRNSQFCGPIYIGKSY